MKNPITIDGTTYYWNGRDEIVVNNPNCEHCYIEHWTPKKQAELRFRVITHQLPKFTGVGENDANIS
jgi:hypothetical protein